MEQAAAELRKSLERAQNRTSRNPRAPILPQHFTDLIKAARFLEASLQTLCDAHPGDTRRVLVELIHERSGLPGWDNWVSLLREQLTSDNGLVPGHPEDDFDAGDNGYAASEAQQGKKGDGTNGRL